MRYAICILLVCTSKAILSQELDIKYNEIENKVVKRKLVEAKLGEDIYAPGLTTIVLDASASTPQNGSLTYEWSFPPNMIYIDEYKFNDSDTPVRYENLADERPSLRMLTTRNKFIEVDLPNLPGQAYEVSLRVQNHVGMDDQDNIVITIQEPVSIINTNVFTDSLLTKTNSEKKIFVNESIENREALQETIIHDRLITIQAINKNRLNSMEIDVINTYIYQLLKDRGIKEVLDPNRFIPNEIKVNKLFSRTRYEQDTVQITYFDTVSSGEDLSSFATTPIDTLFKDFIVDDTTTKSKAYYVYKEFKTNVAIDTLTYTEVVDTILEYKFDCTDYDCAAENAYLEQAGSILSWGINDYNELEFHYYKLGDIYSTKPQGRWIVEPNVFNPLADSLIRYPESIAFDSTGSPIIVTGNNQDIIYLNKSSNPISVMNNYSEGYNIDYPSDITSGGLGELYIADKTNNSVFWLYEGVISTIYSTPTYEDGSVIAGEPTLPVAVRLNSSEDIVVLFEGDGSVRKFDRKGQQTVMLQPGIIKHPSDIAIDNNDTLFVASKSNGLVYKVKSDTEIVIIAGNARGITAAMDGVLASDSYLGEPVSIDFDISNRLYIADNSFGAIRVVTPDGIISSLTDNENKVFNISKMRVNNHNQTTLYTSHILEHRINRIEYQIFAKGSRFSYVHYPLFTIKKDGIYGLEKSIKSAVESVLDGIIPRERKSIAKRITESRQKISSYFRSHPFIFAILLIALNQGFSMVVDDGGPIDLPPDFPPI